MTFLVLASTLRDPGAFEVLKTGKPCTAAPEKVDFFRPEGAATGVIVSADTATAAMAVSNANSHAHSIDRSKNNDDDKRELFLRRIA